MPVFPNPDRMKAGALEAGFSAIERPRIAVRADHYANLIVFGGSQCDSVETVLFQKAG